MSDTAGTEASEATAADALFRAERAAMVRLAVLLVGSRAAAEEIVQDSFAAVLARWKTIERPGAYLRTTVVNGCRMALRRRAAEQRHLATFSAAELPPEAPVELVELHDVLRALPERQRLVVVLRYLADLPDAEIAELLACRPSTVRSLARRALSHLRKELS